MTCAMQRGLWCCSLQMMAGTDAGQCLMHASVLLCALPQAMRFDSPTANCSLGSGAVPFHCQPKRCSELEPPALVVCGGWSMCMLPALCA